MVNGTDGSGGTPVPAGQPSMPVGLAEINGDLCVHGFCATASCSACVTACPRAALVLNDQSLGFDESACDGCGLCRPACPEGAIRVSGGALQPLLDGRGHAALIACEHTRLPPGPGIVPCLHAFGRRELDHLADDGVAVIVAARGDCASCPRSTGKTIEAALVRSNASRSSRRETTLRYEHTVAAQWLKRQSEVIAAKFDIDQSRRALFGGILQRRPSASAATAEAWSAHELHHVVPELDVSLCVGCDACSRICPHGAISLQGGGTSLHYAIRAQECTGCRLCLDVCDVNAVSLRELARCEQHVVALKGQTCRKCGVPFHQPQTAPDGTGICRICRHTDHTRNLFQVRT